MGGIATGGIALGGLASGTVAAGGGSGFITEWAWDASKSFHDDQFVIVTKLDGSNQNYPDSLVKSTLEIDPECEGGEPKRYQGYRIQNTEYGGEGVNRAVLYVNSNRRMRLGEDIHEWADAYLCGRGTNYNVFDDESTASNTVNFYKVTFKPA